MQLLSSRASFFSLVANENLKLLGRSQSEAQVFWENQGKNGTCRRSGFFGTFHKLATIMCITDQAFSKFSGSAEARKAESRKSLGSVGRFLYGFLLGWKRERAVGARWRKGSDGTRWMDWREAGIMEIWRVSEFAMSWRLRVLCPLDVQMWRVHTKPDVDLFEWWRDFFPKGAQFARRSQARSGTAGRNMKLFGVRASAIVKLFRVSTPAIDWRLVALYCLI